VQNDLGLRAQTFERGHAADVIHVRVRERDGLQIELVPVERGHDPFGVVARIDAHGPTRLLAPYDARNLLKSSDDDLFDNHSVKLNRDS
jgi:hypothetical protein